MNCPACQSDETKVIDSRESENGLAIRRRRECLVCHFRFSTLERVEILNLEVLKKRGEREPYTRQKLEAGIRKALKKRPFSEEEIVNFIDQVEREILRTGQNPIKTRTIGEITLRNLKELDEVAYIRFASVYRSFSDLDSFARELKKIKLSGPHE